MPRYTLTPEEFAAVEKLRAKQAHTIGYNEGLEIAAIEVEHFVPTYKNLGSGGTAGEAVTTSPASAPSSPAVNREALATYLRSLKRELPL